MIWAHGERDARERESVVSQHNFHTVLILHPSPDTFVWLSLGEISSFVHVSSAHWILRHAPNMHFR